MLLLLPPSETKRDGGSAGSVLDLGALHFAELARPRRTVLAALRRLGGNASTMSRALGLGPRQAFEVERNRMLRSSPTMPAMDRYTGVLYDALDAASLSTAGREFARGRVAIHSALFGLIDATDPIPAYRLSHDSRMPALSLKATWRAPVEAVLAGHGGLIVDLRSEAYAQLGPAPEGAVFLRVVSEHVDGRRRALNHFNKRGKGEFVRAVLQSGIDHGSVGSLLDWAAQAGVRLEPGRPGEVQLVL